MEPFEPNPEQIGPYRILERLGRGGMGVVYRAVHRQTGELVALKTVRAASERHLGAIRREVRALAQVRHPGVVHIFGEGLERGLPWYAMELLQGMTLREFRFFSGKPALALDPRRNYWTLNLRPAQQDIDTSDAPTIVREEGLESAEIVGVLDPILPPPPQQRQAGDLRQLLTLFHRLAGPLAYVHGEGLAHCDLKPENIFIRFDQQPVLVDFGLISRFGGALHREVLEVDLFMGTAEYMAPEQWQAKPLDPRTDLYALGIILYECLTGEPPYLGTREQIRAGHLQGKIPSVRAKIPSLPVAVDHLLGALLAKSPSDRLGSALDVRSFLEEMGAEPQTRPEPPPKPYLFRPDIAGRKKISVQVAQSLATDLGHLVLVGGESGVGKTRLALEIARAAKKGGMRVVTGECSPAGLRDTGLLQPLRPFLQAVADKCLGAPQLFPSLLGQRAGTLARVEPSLTTVPGVNADLPLSPKEEQDRLVDDFLLTLAAFGRQESITLVLDDLQWADELTLQVLRSFVLRADECRHVSILGTYRTEEPRPELTQLIELSGVDNLVLPRLGGPAVHDMVRDMLGHPPQPSFVQFLTNESEGNPFFVAEYLRAAVAAQVLSKDKRGQWAVAATSDTYGNMGLPRTLHDLVAHRIVALSVEARTLLLAAAVLGREAPFELIAATSTLEAPAAEAAVNELLQKQVLEETFDGALRFSHDKLREVAYAQLDPAGRARLHGRAARASLKPNADPAVLAHHYEKANEPKEAIEWLERAAERALAAGAHREGRDFLQRIGALVPQVATDFVPPLRKAEQERKLARIALAMGELRDTERHATNALDLLQLKPPRSRLAWAGRLWLELGRQIAHRLLPPGWYQRPQNKVALELIAEVVGRMARVAVYQNDGLRVMALSLWSINRAEQAGQMVEAARNYSGLGWILDFMRLPRLANRYFERARLAGEATRDYNGLVFALTAEALCRTGHGQWDATMRALEACVGPCEVTRDPTDRELVEMLHSHVTYLRGQFTQSLASGMRVRESAHRRENLQHESWGLFAMARCSLALQRPEEALPWIEEALALLARATVADRLSEAINGGLQASALLALDRLEEAEKHLAPLEAMLDANPPTMFLYFHADEGIAAVRLARLAQDPRNPGARADATRALARFEKIARAFPVTQARASLYRGRFQRLLGQTARARQTWTQGLARAQQLDLQHDRQLLTDALSQLESSAG